MELKGFIKKILDLYALGDAVANPEVLATDLAKQIEENFVIFEVDNEG